MRRLGYLPRNALDDCKSRIREGIGIQCNNDGFVCGKVRRELVVSGQSRIVLQKPDFDCILESYPHSEKSGSRREQREQDQRRQRMAMDDCKYSHGLGYPSMQDPIVVIQNLLPQPWLARKFGRMARSERPWLKNLLIRLWMRMFGVSLEESARASPGDYATFEDFFTRELRSGVRPQPEDPRVLAAPVDGYLREFGYVNDGRLLQAKGIDYPLGALLGDDVIAEHLGDGWYATIYLSPADYHRVHAPFDAVLCSVTEIPGTAYSVTSRTERVLPDLYCRNERLACTFETRFGPMVLVMVGAMLVTGIETVWRRRQPIVSMQTTRHCREFARGEEVGRFTFGSTVIIVLPRNSVAMERTLRKDQRIRFGESMGRVVVL